ncbi:hypothetical protein L916_18088, partial [Phytophthora nicotianae]
MSTALDAGRCSPSRMEIPVPAQGYPSQSSWVSASSEPSRL